MKKKIMLLAPSLRKGGAENQLVRLALFLNSKEYEVVIMTLLSGNDFNEILKENKIRLLNGNFKSLKGFFKFFIVFRKEQPDLIISFMFAANIIGRFLKLFFNVSLITSVRSNEISNIYKFLYRFTYKLDNLSTFNSFYSYEKFIKLSLTLKGRSIVLNNAIEFDSEYKRKNYETKNPFIIVSIAHFRKAKDYPTLFKAIQKVKNLGYNIQLNVLGIIGNQTWPYQMIKELGIDKNVVLIGFSSQTNKYLEQANALVLSSFHEGTPNALLEAMSKKLPIIASNVPGNDYVVNESGAGYLFEVSNEIDLADKIIKLICLDPLERKNFGDAGFEFIRREYEMNKVLIRWEKCIEPLLK